MAYRKVRNETEWNRAHVDLGLLDQRGRAIGVVINRRELDLVEIPDAEWGYKLPAGHYHGAIVEVARNGHSFGASQSEHLASSEAELNAYIAKRISGARTRYERLSPAHLHRYRNGVCACGLLMPHDGDGDY